MGLKDMFPVLAKDSNLTESEFFYRELNMVFVDKPKFTKGGKLLIACTNPALYKDILDSLPQGKVIFFLLGNETYDVPTYKYLSSFPSLKRAYIYNPPRPNSLIGLPSVWASLIDIPKTILDPKFYRTCKNSFDFAKRSRKLNLSFEWKPFPQGYSRRFVQELKLLGIIRGGGSLFNDIDIPIGLPPKGIGFVGQRGSWFRSKQIDTFSSRPNFSYIESNGWTSSQSSQTPLYVNSILENRTTLHLPGNVTNQTHRYMESLLLNRLPTSPSYTLQDHHLTDYWPEGTIYQRNFSYRRLSSKILKMNDEEYKVLVKFGREKLQRWINELRLEVKDFYLS